MRPHSRTRDRDEAASATRHAPRTPPPAARTALPQHDLTASGAISVRARRHGRAHRENQPDTIHHRPARGQRPASDRHGGSREHAEIVNDGSSFRLHDRGSSYGTFVNDRLVTEHVLVPGDRIRLGRGRRRSRVQPRGHAQLTSRSSSNPITDIRLAGHAARRPAGLGPGRVLQEVLAVVLDSAITLSSDAERGFIMLATPEGVLDVTLGRARAERRWTATPSGRAGRCRKRPRPARFRSSRTCRSSQEDDHLRTMEPGIGTRSRPAPGRSALCRRRRVGPRGRSHRRAVPRQP